MVAVLQTVGCTNKAGHTPNWGSPRIFRQIEDSGLIIEEKILTQKVIEEARNCALRLNISTKNGWAS